LHDVDLAALRPAHGIDIRAKHPERRPDPFAIRQLDARFDAAASKRKESLGLDASGSVIAARILQRANDQMAFAVLEDVLSGVGVRLDLAVAAAIVAEIVSPFLRVGGLVGGPVKLVAPDQFPACGGLRADGG